MLLWLKIQFLDQQIEDLKGKLAVKEAAALLPYEKEVEEARSAYLRRFGKYQRSQTKYWEKQEFAQTGKMGQIEDEST